MQMLKSMWKDLMLHASFWSVLCYAIAFPVTWLTISKEITPGYMAIECMAVNLAVIASNSAFVKYAEKLYKLFPHMCVVESVTYTALVVCVINGWMDLKVYFLLNTVITIMVTRNMCCAGTRLKRLRYSGEHRERFDLTNQIVTAAAAVLASVIVLIYTPPVVVAWILTGVGVSIDNIFYVICWWQTKDTSEQKESITTTTDPVAV